MWYSRITIIIGCLIGMALGQVSPLDSAMLSHRSTYHLPWEKIAEQNGIEKPSYTRQNSYEQNNYSLNRNLELEETKIVDGYACELKKAIFISLPLEISAAKLSKNVIARLSKWTGGIWYENGRISGSIVRNRLVIPGGIEEEGLFRLTFAIKSSDETAHSLEVYAIVSKNWKMDILAFCRKQKEWLETNPDPKLIRSCISISHFDHVMEITSDASILSDNILKALSTAVQSRMQFEQGECPDFLIGLNKTRLKRFEGALIEEFVVFIPDDYSDSEKWPVFLHTDNRRWAAGKKYKESSGLIDIWWHTVTDINVNWKNYSAFISILKQKLNIDEDRIYINGECGNGLAAMSLALNYPDQWAECSVSLANTYRHMAGNALNLDLIFVKGGHDEEDYVGYYDFARRCFQYFGCYHFIHSVTEEVPQARGMEVPQSVRRGKPIRVFHTIESLGNSSSYWLRIDGRDDENFNSSIDACIQGQKIYVDVNNVDAYTFDLNKAPLDANRPVKIIENFQTIDVVKDSLYSKKPEKYNSASYVKNEFLHGPVSDVFTDPYVIIWGNSSKDKQDSLVNKQLAASFANGAPCYADNEAPEKLISSHNLLLIGQVQSNVWLSKIFAKIPKEVVSISESTVITHGRHFTQSDLGLILVYPNPLDPSKYVAIFTGTTPKAIKHLQKAYSQMNSMRPSDIGVFQVIDDNRLKWHIFEKLNTVWNWHRRWNDILTRTEKKHPAWQWHRWAAKAIKCQTGADVTICEQPLRFADSIPVGQLSYRDLANTFMNLWIVTIELDGSQLRKMLMVPFNDIFERKVNVPVIEGIRFTKDDSDSPEKILSIDEIESTKKYKLACNYKCLNGKRVGQVLQDYKITGQEYLVPMLREYLESISGTDIDDQLDSLKFRMY